MNLFLDGLGFMAGLVLVYRAGVHIETMTWRSNHFMRAGYYAVAVGGAALVLAPFADEDWLQAFGFWSTTLGGAMLLSFDKRRPAGSGHREPPPVAGRQ